MENIRNQLIEQINPLLSELINKANQGRFNGDTETYKLRISYVNALANLLRAFNQLMKDKEIDELANQIEELQNAINQSIEKKDYTFTTGNK